MILFRLIKVFMLILPLVGCSHILDDMDLRNETVLPPAIPIDQPLPKQSTGSIYQQGQEISLYRDNLPQRIGDMLTVKLEETTKGEKQANTKTTKTTSDSTNNGTQVDPHGDIQPWIAGSAYKLLNFNVGSDLQFDGKGSTNEQNNLRGTVTVTVTRVLSNGNLVVQGESWVTINQGREYVRLSGIVRVVDIQPDNSVSSQRIANARIEFSGNGQVGNSSRGGLLTQLLSKFFPY